MLRSPVAHSTSIPSSHAPRGHAELHGLLLIGALVLLASLLTFAMLNAMVRGNEKKAARDRIAQIVETEKREKDRLLVHKNYLTSTEGIESAAHNQGMVRPGEEIMRLSTDKTPSAPPPPPSTPGPLDEHPTAGGVLLAGLALFTLAFFSGMALLFLRWRAARTRTPVGALTPRSELRRRRPAHGQ
jgi:hypothetical protein